MDLIDKIQKKLNDFNIAAIPLGFLFLILIGSVVLSCPLSVSRGNEPNYLTALFTATTSVCVTGCTVVSTFSYWSTFGKLVILILIQLGGLGLIAVTSLFILIKKRKMSLRNLLLLRDTFDLETFKDVRFFLRKVFIWTFSIEFTGAVFYSVRLIPKYGVLKGAAYSLFTSISAFCNAGIDILGENSLIDYSSDHYILITTMMLIILGGIGFVVLIDFSDNVYTNIKNFKTNNRRVRRISEHTKLVLLVTAILIIVGAAVIFFIEYNNPATIGNMSVSDGIMNAVFESVTARTAGFYTFPQEELEPSSCLVMCVLMFIGGSPVGTAGGVKVVVIVVIIMSDIALVRGNEETLIFNKRIDRYAFRKAVAIFSINLQLVIFASIILMYIEKIRLVDCFFEVFSSVSTVGLSRNLTPTLGTGGKFVIMIAMFFGRIGPITAAFVFGRGNNKIKHITHGNGHFYLG